MHKNHSWSRIARELAVNFQTLNNIHQILFQCKCLLNLVFFPKLVFDLYISCPNIVINEVFVEHYRSGDNNGEPFSLVCPTEVEGQGDGTCWICTHKHPVITRPTFPGNAPRTSSSSPYRPQVYQLSNRVIYGHLSPWRVKVAPYLS